MKYIGKSNKYYTLWEVTVEPRTTSRGQPYTVTHHIYLKNISFDKDKAVEKYPEAIIDESLRGHSSWTSYDYPTLPIDEFSCGKYSGEKIAECKDYNYLHWCWDNGSIIPYESRDIAIKILEDAGYKQINENKIVTAEEYKKILESFDECEDGLKLLDETGEITFEFTKNLNEEGEIRINNIHIKFQNYKTLEYDGYPYGLPVDNKGKAKRIKNKKVKLIPESYEMIISEFGWGATLDIVVKDFEIL